MKFFFLKLYNTKTKTKVITTFNKKAAYLIQYNSTTNPTTFSKFLIKDGFLLKNRLVLSNVYKNINYFLYNNLKFIKINYPSLSWILDDIIDKKLNYVYLFDVVSNLIKPPFIVKSVVIPKKLRKKTKQKYLIKIVYKNENKRLKNSYKQLYYYSNKFTDSKFNVRLYKSLVFSFLDWKNSYLFKLKSLVFKKFFKV